MDYLPTLIIKTNHSCRCRLPYMDPAVWNRNLLFQWPPCFLHSSSPKLHRVSSSLHLSRDVWTGVRAPNVRVPMIFSWCFLGSLGDYNYPPGNYSNISPQNGTLKMIFLFPRWDMLIPWRVYSRITIPWLDPLTFAVSDVFFSSSALLQVVAR